MADYRTLKLSGTCNLTWDGELYECILCEVDTQEGVLVCHIPLVDYKYLANQSNYELLSIQELQLNSLSGPLRASEVKIAFASSIKGARLSIDQTDLGQISGIKPQMTTLSLVLNAQLTLICNTEGEETLFLPSLETTGRVQVEDNLYIVGAKEYLSVIGNHGLTESQLAICVSIVVGAPAMPIIVQKSYELKLYLNHFRPSKSRPLFDRGWPYSVREKLQTGVAELFRVSKEFVSNLDEAEYAKFSNATNTFMQTLSSNQSIELKLLGAYYFLEWLDGSRRISENELVKLLQVSRLEANVIKKVRDELIHNRRLLHQVLTEAADSLSKIPESNFGVFRSRSADISYTNYLITNVTKAFLGKLGYTGKVAPYLPLNSFD